MEKDNNKMKKTKEELIESILKTARENLEFRIMLTEKAEKALKKTKTYQKDKESSSPHSGPLTPSEMESLRQDFYQAAKWYNLPNAEEFLIPPKD